MWTNWNVKRRWTTLNDIFAKLEHKQCYTTSTSFYTTTTFVRS
jgi:hypothetical protein